MKKLINRPDRYLDEDNGDVLDTSKSEPHQRAKKLRERNPEARIRRRTGTSGLS